MAEQYGRAERKAHQNNKFYKQTGIFDCLQHGKSLGAVLLAGRPDCGGLPLLRVLAMNGFCDWLRRAAQKPAHH